MVTISVIKVIRFFWTRIVVFGSLLEQECLLSVEKLYTELAKNQSDYNNTVEDDYEKNRSVSFGNR